MKTSLVILVLLITTNIFASTKLNCSVVDLSDNILDSGFIDLSMPKALLELDIKGEQDSHKFLLEKGDKVFYFLHGDNKGLSYMKMDLSLINRMRAGEKFSFRVLPLNPDSLDLTINCTCL